LVFDQIYRKMYFNSVFAAHEIGLLSYLTLDFTEPPAVELQITYFNLCCPAVEQLPGSSHGDVPEPGEFYYKHVSYDSPQI